LFVDFFCESAVTGPLSVEKIMRDQKWIGLGPFDYCWSADSKTLFFSWNPEARNEPELYALDVASAKYRKTDKSRLTMTSK
jgi:hypothetical protein